MKSVLIFFAVLGVAYGAVVAQPLASRDLHDDLQDFISLIPTGLVVEHTMYYIQNDAEFQSAMSWLFTQDFAAAYQTLLSIPEVMEYVQFLKDHGLQVDRYIEWVREFLGIPRARSDRVLVSASRNGFSGWFNGLMELLPTDEIHALATEKLQTSESFRALYEALRSENFQDVVRRLRANETYQSIVAKLANFNIDLERVGQFFVRVFGWDL